MRDIAFTVIISWLVFQIYKRPWIGVLVWLWLSVMNPQKYAFGFANSAPFAALVAVVTLISMLKHKEQVKLPINPTTVLLMLFPLWMCVTTLFALEPDNVYGRWNQVMKIFFFLLIGASLINCRKHVEWMVWVIVFSVGYFGVKGGIFTILSGGNTRVYGPPGDGFMSDNNAIAVALVMVIPLMYFLRSIVASKWIKLGLLAAIGLSAMASLGSQSRGALLAIAAMALFSWIKSPQKIVSGMVMVILLPLAIGFMPSSWTSRMKTIETYEEDTSAMGRINAWTMAINVANDRPLVGGGFELYTGRVFAKYAPDPTDVHAAHSIYFQILGEHGYVGLALFLGILAVAWFNANQIIRHSSKKPEYAWAASYAKAVQVSLFAYIVGGAFINIGYWEFQYYEIVGLMVVRGLVTTPKLNWAMQQAQSRQPKPVGG